MQFYNADDKIIPMGKVNKKALKNRSLLDRAIMVEGRTQPRFNSHVKVKLMRCYHIGDLKRHKTKLTT